jgi:Uma2 family endonuclease
MSLMPTRDTSQSAQGGKLTYDDFLLFPEDGMRHELIDGEHVVSASPNLKHQAVVVNLVTSIRTYLRANPIGKVFIGPTDVVLSNVNVLVPDVLYVSQTRATDVLTAPNVWGAPDLVVEVGSPSTRRRDERIKHRLYEQFGVSEYWVVDPDLDAIKVYRLTGDRYALVHELSLERDDVLATPFLPGLAIPLAEIFEQ